MSRGGGGQGVGRGGGWQHAEESEQPPWVATGTRPAAAWPPTLPPHAARFCLLVFAHPCLPSPGPTAPPHRRSIVYDTTAALGGSLGLKAIRLSDSFVEAYREGEGAGLPLLS